jgi:hypothetical protein
MSLRDTFIAKPLDVKLNVASVNMSTAEMQKSDKGEILFVPGSPAEIEDAKKKQTRSIAIAVVVAIIILGAAYYFTRKKA